MEDARVKAASYEYVKCQCWLLSNWAPRRGCVGWEGRCGASRLSIQIACSRLRLHDGRRLTTTVLPALACYGNGDGDLTAPHPARQAQETAETRTPIPERPMAYPITCRRG